MVHEFLTLLSYSYLVTVFVLLFFVRLELDSNDEVMKKVFSLINYTFVSWNEKKVREQIFKNEKKNLRFFQVSLTHIQFSSSTK